MRRYLTTPELHGRLRRHGVRLSLDDLERMLGEDQAAGTVARHGDGWRLSETAERRHGAFLRYLEPLSR